MSEIYEDEDSRTIFCGNLSDKVTEAILYELFLQGGPLEKVSLPKDKDGRARNYDQSSLRSGFQQVQTRASLLPQLSNRSSNQFRPNQVVNADDLLTLGNKMLQSSSKRFNEIDKERYKGSSAYNRNVMHRSSNRPHKMEPYSRERDRYPSSPRRDSSSRRHHRSGSDRRRY